MMRTYDHIYPCQPSIPNATCGGNAQADSLPSELKRVTSTEIAIPTHDEATIQAYLATPVSNADSPPAATVIILCDIFGYQSAETRAVADLLASHSLAAIVPDIYRGHPWPRKPIDDDIAAWFEKHSLDRIHKDVAATEKVLQSRGLANSIGLVGFCFGGGRVLHEIGLVGEGLNPKAAVAFYPTKCDFVKPAETAASPLLVIAGDEDAFTPMDDLNAFRNTLKSKNTAMTDCEMILVKGATHGFVHMPQSEEDKSDSPHILNKAAAFLSRYLL